MLLLTDSNPSEGNQILRTFFSLVFRVLVAFRSFDAGRRVFDGNTSAVRLLKKFFLLCEISKKLYLKKWNENTNGKRHILV